MQQRAGVRLGPADLQSDFCRAKRDNCNHSGGTARWLCLAWSFYSLLTLKLAKTVTAKVKAAIKAMETGQSQATLSATPIRLPPGSWRSLATLVIGAGYHPVTDLTCLLFTIETKLNKRTLTAGVALPVKPAGNASPSPNPVPRSPVYTHTHLGTQ